MSDTPLLTGGSSPQVLTTQSGQPITVGQPPGTVADFTSRLLGLLPIGWFPTGATVVTGLVTGIATGLAALFQQLVFVTAQTRLATMSGAFLDLFANDYFGFGLLRRAGEVDASYRGRISAELLRPRGTRAAVISALTSLTGQAPIIFEPARPYDTGGYGIAMGYATAGGYGSLAYPFQFFVTAFRPLPSGIAGVAGYGIPIGAYGEGASEYAGLSTVEAAVTDADIYAVTANTAPAAYIAWTRIEN